MRWILFIAALVAVGTDDAELARLRAEVKQLHATIESQRKEIERLRSQAQTQPSGAVGAPAAVRGRARSVVYAIDLSASMLNKFAEARDQTLRAIAELGPKDRFGVVAGNEGVQRLAPSLIPATRANMATARDMVAALIPRGTDNFSKLLKAALALKPDVIWVATDADIGQGADLREALSAARSGHARINVAVFGDTPDADGLNTLIAIARDTGGSCIDGNGDPIKPPAPRADAPTLKPGPSIFRDD